MDNENGKYQNQINHSRYLLSVRTIYGKYRSGTINTSWNAGKRPPGWFSAREGDKKKDQSMFWSVATLTTTVVVGF